MEIKCQLDATEVFIADLIACSTCFGHHYAHHQELPVVFRAVVFQVDYVMKECRPNWLCIKGWRKYLLPKYQYLVDGPFQSRRWKGNLLLLQLLILRQLCLRGSYIWRRYWWSRSGRRRSAASRLLGIAGSYPAGGMDLSCECCALSGRGLCNGPIPRPEEAYRVWYVWMWSRNLKEET